MWHVSANAAPELLPLSALGRTIRRRPSAVAVVDAALILMLFDVARSFPGAGRHPAWNWLVVGSCVYCTLIELLFRSFFLRSERATPDVAATIRFTFAQSPALFAFAARSIGADQWALVLGVATTIVLTTIGAMRSRDRA